MAQKVLVSKNNLGNIANAIRTKNGTSSKYTPANMAAAISAIPGGSYNWRGEGVTFVEDLFEHTYNLKNDTTFSSWTASTTAKSIMTTKTADTFVATNMDQYSYLLRWVCITNVAHATGATLQIIPIQQFVIFDQIFYRRPQNWSKLLSREYNYNTYYNATAVPLCKYYNSTGDVSVGWTASYGLYGSVPTPTISNNTTASPTITAKTPLWYARCSTTYFDTARYSDIDQTNTTFTVKASVYKLDNEKCLPRQRYTDLVEFIHDYDNLDV